MWFASLLRNLKSNSTGKRKSAPRFRPHLEALEGRDLPSFSAPVAYYSLGTVALATGDVSGDGKPDLIKSFASGTGVQLNNGNGTFGAADWTPTLVGTLGPATALAVVSGQPYIWEARYLGGDSTQGSFVLYQFNSNGTFTILGTDTPYPDTGESSSLAVADLAGNGDEDLVGVPTLHGPVYVAQPGPSGPFAVVQTYNFPGVGGTYPIPNRVTVGDFNGDGKPDIVVSEAKLANYISVLLNNGNGTFGTAQKYTVGGNPAAVATGDLTGGGHVDIVTANTNGTVSVLPGLGNGTFGAAQNYAIAGPASSVAVGDFNNDGHLDIATTGATEMDVLLNNGNGTFAAYQKVGPAGSDLVAADFNGDGYPDLAQIDATKNNIVVLLNTGNWGPTPSFAVSGFPAPTTAGVAQTFTVTALNPDGTVDTGYTGTVHFTSSDPQAVLPANSTLTNGAGTFQATLETAGTQSITATDTTTGSITGHESGITVNPAAAATLVFSNVPVATTAGSGFSLTLTAKDLFGNIATGYTGTIHFGSSDPLAVRPANYTFTSGDAGQHTLSVTLKTAGSQSVTATDTLTSSITGTSSGIAVNPAAASKFVLSALSSVTHGVAFSVTLTVEDAYGNVVTGYQGKVHFKSSDGTATLPANYTFTAADAGVHTFTGLVLRKRGKQTLTVTDTQDSALTAIDNIKVS
jgi:hypothetical protein